MTTETPPRPATPFARYLAALEARGDADTTLAVGARDAFAALEAAVAIGRTLLPEDKFTTANALELARLVYEADRDARAEAGDPGGESDAPEEADGEGPPPRGPNRSARAEANGARR